MPLQHRHIVRRGAVQHWYNNHRLHSLLDLITPEEFEQAYYAHETGSPTGDAANTKTA